MDPGTQPLSLIGVFAVESGWLPLDNQPPQKIYYFIRSIIGDKATVSNGTLLNVAPSFLYKSGSKLTRPYPLINARQ